MIKRKFPSFRLGSFTGVLVERLPSHPFSTEHIPLGVLILGRVCSCLRACHLVSFPGLKSQASSGSVGPGTPE